jgi:CubicO group peptidase (beta-lactamase class C family)
MKRIVILLFCLSSAFSLFSQPIDRKILLHRVDSLIQRIHTLKTPGGAVAVVSGKGTLYQKVYGMMSMEYKLPNTNTTLFNLASVSKQFTAFCALLLEREGKIDLDDDIRMYLYDLPDFGYKITIRELIHHTSGIASSDNLRLFAGLPFEAPWDADDEMKLLGRYNQLNYVPNSERNYSNTGYFLLAKIVEAASCQSFSDYITENVFKPLGMDQSFVYDSPGKIISNKASGYKKTGNTFIKMNTEGESVYGSTNIYTSLNDMAIWMKNLLQPKVGDKEMMNRLFYPCDTTNDGETINYSYGFNVWNYMGLKVADHGGYAMGFRTELMVFPENDIAIVVMTNNESTDTWGLTTKIADWVFRDQLKPEKKKDRIEIKLAPEKLKTYAGTYRMSDGMKLNLELNNDTLCLLIPGEPKFVLHPASDTEFFVKEFDARCSFEFGSDGTCSGITWYQNNRQPKGMKISYSDLLSSDELQQYTGNYVNEALNVTYPVLYKNNRLFLVVPKTFKTYFGTDCEVKLEYLEPGRFFTQRLGVVEFTKDDSKNITGFKIVDFGRVKNLEFKRKG